jgi:outer membrane protein TolC
VLFRTLRDLSSARYNYLLSRLQLEAVTGTLDVQDIESINQLLTYPDR